MLGPSLCHNPTNPAPVFPCPRLPSLTTCFLFSASCAMSSAQVSVTNLGLVSCWGWEGQHQGFPLGCDG